MNDLLLKRRVSAAVTRFFKETRPVGLIVGVLPEGAAERWIFARGETRESRGQPPRRKTIWQIGSITKTFTATLLALAQAEGELQIDDFAQQYAPPDVKLPTFDTWDQSVPIRLVQLATHTAGLPLDPRGVRPGGYSVEQMYDYLRLYALAIDPGRNWNYSNVGFGLLANLLQELRAAKSYQELVDQLKIAARLPMPDTLIRLSLQQRERRAWGYTAPGKRAKWRTSTWPAFDGSGALYSTIDDMLTWLAYNLGCLASPQDDLLPVTQKIYFAKGENRMGLAWERGFYGPVHHPYWGKGGNTTGFTSYIALTHRPVMGTVILCNSAWCWPEDLATEILTILSTGTED